MTEDDRFTLSDLHAMLATAGVAPELLRGDGGLPLEALGVDSIVYLVVQLDLHERYGLTLSSHDAPLARTAADVVDHVNALLSGQGRERT